jgi:hypothetical protein
MAKTLGSGTIGDLVKLNVDGTERNFIIVHQGLPSSVYDSSCDGTWLLMEELYELKAWDSTTHEYGNSDIHAYLNNTFINLFDSDVKNAIKQVKIPYSTGKSYNIVLQTGSKGLSTKIFLPSKMEVEGTSNEFFNAEGALLDYFVGAENADRLAYLNGAATEWWLRTPQNKLSTVNVSYIDSVHGITSIQACSNSIGIRPALILPSTFEAEYVSSINGHVTIGGAQKEIVGAYANIGGTWKEITKAYSNIGGTWKE